MFSTGGYMNRRIISTIAVLALAFTAVSIQASWFSKKTDSSQQAATSSDANVTATQSNVNAEQRLREALKGRQFGGLNSRQPVKPINVNDISYGIGFTMGSNFNKQKMEVNADELMKGFRAGLSGEKGKFTPEEVRSMMMNYQRQMMAKRAEERTKSADSNQQAGEAFLQKNKLKTGIKTTASGLQYRVIKIGSGKKPTDKDTVSVTYSGRLIDGEVFSSSEDPKKPAVFRLNGVIPAWKEGLQMMPAGSTWEFFVPAKLAYGARGAGAKIGPNATLIFKITLIDVKASEKKKES